jgi:hypothetical protein
MHEDDGGPIVTGCEPGLQKQPIACPEGDVAAAGQASLRRRTVANGNVRSLRVHVRRDAAPHVTHEEGEGTRDRERCKDR